jgi:hypothetical protein
MTAEGITKCFNSKQNCLKLTPDPNNSSQI